MTLIKDFVGIDFVGIDFVGVDFVGIDFVVIDLIWIDLVWVFNLLLNSLFFCILIQMNVCKKFTKTDSNSMLNLDQAFIDYFWFGLEMDYVNHNEEI